MEIHILTQLSTAIILAKTRLESLLNECGFSMKRYGISERYLSGMEIVAQKN